MNLPRENYVNALLERKDNGLVKVITGVRRVGKSYLLFTLYRNWLLEMGISPEHIVEAALDDDAHARLRDPEELSKYLRERITPEGRYYVFLDEIQFVKPKLISNNPEITITFYDVVNGISRLGNVDVYVTGSNSRMLSKDVLTEFRGRADRIHVYPLSFKEFHEARKGEFEDDLLEYLAYGGMPGAFLLPTEIRKREYLSSLFEETYLKDILERNNVGKPAVLSMLVDVLCSSSGSLVNASKLSRSLESELKAKMDSETVAQYLDYLVDSFLFVQARRYDVRGRKYLSYPSKFYPVDTGLSNARTNMRQLDRQHLLENAVFVELLRRGHSVDVGLVEKTVSVSGKMERRQLEIDFVLNASSSGRKRYVQLAWSLEGEGKLEQETRPFLGLGDDFNERVLISHDCPLSHYDENGILHLSLKDFLLDENVLR